MDAVIGNEKRLRAFRAVDEFAIEAYRASRGLTTAVADALAWEIRRATARAGGALVASGSATDTGRAIAAARSGLLEARYYLSLARRLGHLDARRYRALATRQDAALREIDALSRPLKPAATVDSIPRGC